MIKPIDPGQRRQFHGLAVFSGLSMDHIGFIQAFGQSIVIGAGGQFQQDGLPERDFIVQGGDAGGRSQIETEPNPTQMGHPDSSWLMGKFISGNRLSKTLTGRSSRHLSGVKHKCKTDRSKPHDYWNCTSQLNPRNHENY